MAGSARSFEIEQQTAQIVQCLFDDEQVDVRCQFDEYETDSPVADGENFDPHPIAETLKKVADRLNEDANFRAALVDLKLAIGQEAMEGAFSRGVDALLQAQTSHTTVDLAPEIQLIKVSIALGLFLKKTFPKMKSKAQNVVIACINNRAGSYITRRGGWEKVREDIGGI